MQAREPTMTLDDYLADSATWEVKHEWIGGRAWAMVGGSMRHAAVIANVVMALGEALRGSGCRVTSSEQRVWIRATDDYVYPDAVVVCGPFEASPDDAHSLANPAVVVEVLSPSTRSHDLGTKLERYRTMPSLQDAVFVDPEREHVIHVQRVADGWLVRDHVDGAFRLAAGPRPELAIASLYADLDGIP